LDLLVVLRRRLIGASRLDHRQRESVGLHLPIVPARFAQQIRSPHLEPDEVVRVVDHPHLVGLGVTYADPGDGLERAHRGDEAAAPFAAALSSRVARSGSALWNTAEPATMMLAPAATTRATLCRSMPPSISTG